MTNIQGNLFQGALLVLIGLGVFGRVITFDFVPYDDPAYVVENEYVKGGLSSEGVAWALFYDGGGDGLSHRGVENLWHPMTWLSHMLDSELFGVEEPAGHHATSLLLYLTSAVLAMWVFGMLLGNGWAGFWVALLWMVHPLKVESVAWVSERKDVLSGIFFWGSLGCVLRHLRGGRRFWLGVGYAFFVAALLSKPSVVVLPVLVVLVSGFMREEKEWGWRFGWQALCEWWLWFTTAALVAIITVMIQAGGTHSSFAEQSSTMERILNLAPGFWFYWFRVLIPWHLTYEYAQPELGIPLLAVSWLGFIAMAGLAWWRRGKWRGVFFAVVWFVVCWLPASGLVYVGTSFTADRYLYLALAGPLVWLVLRLGDRGWQRGILAVVGLLWASLSWVQTGVWENGWSLFAQATNAQPKVASGWVNLGGMHQQRQNWEKAEECYQQALTVNGSDHVAWFNLGNIYQALQDQEAAREAYAQALRNLPDYGPALLNLGLIARNEGQTAEAREFFRRGAEYGPQLKWLWCESELMLGNWVEARRLLDELEASGVREPGIRAGINRARQFLENQK